MKLTKEEQKLVDLRVKDLEEQNEKIHYELDCYYGYVRDLLKVRIKTAENERIKGLLEKTFYDYFGGSFNNGLGFGVDSMLDYKEKSHDNYEYILRIIKETDAIKVESIKKPFGNIEADFYPMWSENSVKFYAIPCPKCGKWIHKGCYQCTCGETFPEPETEYQILKENEDYIVRKCRGGYCYEYEWVEIVKDGQVFRARQGYVVDDDYYSDEDDFDDDDLDSVEDTGVIENKITIDLDKEELE